MNITIKDLLPLDKEETLDIVAERIEAIGYYPDNIFIGKILLQIKEPTLKVYLMKKVLKIRAINSEPEPKLRAKTVSQTTSSPKQKKKKDKRLKVKPAPKRRTDNDPYYKGVEFKPRNTSNPLGTLTFTPLTRKQAARKELVSMDLTRTSHETKWAISAKLREMQQKMERDKRQAAIGPDAKIIYVPMGKQNKRY